MIWSRIEIEEWVIGVSVTHIYTLHFGPWKLSWIPRGSQLYHDFKRISAPKKKST